MSKGFRRISACPYQNDRGSSAFDETWFGADVAVVPRGDAGVDVCMGAVIGAADTAPGTLHAPYMRRNHTSAIHDTA